MKNKLAQQLENIATQFAVIVTEPNQVVSMLQKAIADQILASFQYWSASNNSRGPGKVDADPQFIAHAKQQWQHVEMLTERVKQLGGFPQKTMAEVFNTVESHAKLGAVSHNVCDLLTVSIEAEKDAIELYKQLIEMTKNNDPTTHRIAKQILQDQEQHKYDLETLKEDICCCCEEQ